MYLNGLVTHQLTNPPTHQLKWTRETGIEPEGPRRKRADAKRLRTATGAKPSATASEMSHGRASSPKAEAPRADG